MNSITTQFMYILVSCALVSSLGTTKAADDPTPKKRVMHFTEPSPLCFDDHKGYASLFDGSTLTGWDGNPKFWRIEDGAIVGDDPDSSNNQAGLFGIEIEAANHQSLCSEHLGEEHKRAMNFHSIKIKTSLVSKVTLITAVGLEKIKGETMAEDLQSFPNQKV